MEQLSDQELITNIQEKNCSQSLEVLSKRHAGMFFTMAKRYANNTLGCSGVSLQDFEDHRHYVVFLAAKSFDPAKKSKFVTWLGNQVRYYCLNTLNAESKYYGAEPEKLDFIINNTVPDERQEHEKLMQEASYVLDILGQLKDERVKKIFEMRYFSEDKKKRSYSYIAKKLGMSTQGVIDLHDNFTKFMRRKMQATSNMDEI